MDKVYRVIVLGVKGEKITVDVANTEEEFNATTALEFKKKLILKLPGLGDVDQIRLIFYKNQLEDADTFSEHQIKDDSIIMLVVRLTGGGGPPPPVRLEEPTNIANETTLKRSCF